MQHASSIHSPHTSCTDLVTASNHHQPPEQTGENKKKQNRTTSILFKMKKTVFTLIRAPYLYIKTVDFSFLPHRKMSASTTDVGRTLVSDPLLVEGSQQKLNFSFALSQ